MANIKDVKKLREETGLSLADVRKALDESGGDIEKAKEWLREKGKATAIKKADREAKAGLIESYIHQTGNVGVLLDIRCETDFVAKSPDFKNLAKEICLQIAAMKPLFVSEDSIPEEFLDGEKKIYEEQVKNSGKPKDIEEQIISGKLEKYKKSVSLLSQTWIKDDNKTIKDLVEGTILKVGEKIEVKQFSCFVI